jgi:WD40 repeat protein
MFTNSDKPDFIPRPETNEEPCWWFSRCNAVAWVPNAEGLFVAGHADGNVYVYDKVSGMKISVLSGESFVVHGLHSLFLDVHCIILLGFFAK